MSGPLQWITTTFGHLQPDDWAAWVQAIGSVAAIGAAIWISSRQSRETKAREEAHCAELRRLAATYAEDASAALKRAVESLDLEDMDEAREVQLAAQDRVQDVANAVQGITPAILPEERTLVALTELRRLLAEAQKQLPFMTAHRGTDADVRAKALLPRLAASVADCAARLRGYC
jgi:hypothetical protein